MRQGGWPPERMARTGSGPKAVKCCCSARAMPRRGAGSTGIRAMDKPAPIGTIASGRRAILKSIPYLSDQPHNPHTVRDLPSGRPGSGAGTGGGRSRKHRARFLLNGVFGKGQRRPVGDAQCGPNALCLFNGSRQVRTAHLTANRRKLAYEALHPETKNGENQHSRVRQVGEGSPADRFTADTAAKTGQSERKVQRAAERGEKVCRRTRSSCCWAGGIIGRRSLLLAERDGIFRRIKMIRPNPPPPSSPPNTGLAKRA